MRTLCIAVFSLFAALLSGLGPYSYGESAEESGISFSLAYKCGTEENGKETEKLCLAGSFKKGLDVVLVTERGACSAKTEDTFTDEYSDAEFQATRLTGAEDCLTGEDRSVVVVGTDPSAVRFIEPNTDISALSKELELKARKVASSGYQKIRATQPIRDVAASPPEVFGVGNAAFLLFKSTDDFLNQDGLPVMALREDVFPLEGACAFRAPFFFSVNGKLHVSYWATVACCGCGDSQFFVYDLSGESPKLAYQNSDFSD